MYWVKIQKYVKLRFSLTIKCNGCIINSINVKVEVYRLFGLLSKIT